MFDATADIEFMIADFGQTVTYTKGESSTDITAIFDNEYEAVDAGGGVPFAMSQPRFYCRTSDVPNAVDGDTLTVNSVVYIIRIVMPDGTGVTELQCEKD